jgi:ornithine cyclodeaminase
MRFVDAATIDRALEVASLVEALRRAFAGELVAPVRHHHTIPRPGADAALLVMPAWTNPAATPAFLGTKVVTVYPDNAARALPSVIGSYLLMDGASGRLLAVMDGTRLTLHRTAAASALAARYLAREDAARMLMVGAGALAPFMIRAHVAVRPGLREIAIWNRTPARAEELARALAGDATLAGRDIRAAIDLEAAVRAADMISCATMAKEPLVHGAWLAPGVHVDLVGAYNLALREADDEALARAAVYIDTPAAKHEGGDVAVALKAGTFAEERIRADLAGLVAGAATGRRSADEITLFKSIGASVEDLAAAVAVWGRVGGV